MCCDRILLRKWQDYAARRRVTETKQMSIKDFFSLQVRYTHSTYFFIHLLSSPLSIHINYLHLNLKKIEPSDYSTHLIPQLCRIIERSLYYYHRLTPTWKLFIRRQRGAGVALIFSPFLLHFKTSFL